MMKTRSLFIFALAVAFSFAGCKTAEKQEDAEEAAAVGEGEEGSGSGEGTDSAANDSPNAGEPALVRTNNAALYRYGPAQGSGPDLTLAAGTLLRVTKKGRAYSTVQMANGVTGFMATRDLTLGDIARLAEARAATASAAQSSASSNGNRTVRYSSTARVAASDSPAAARAPETNAPETPLPDASEIAPEDIDPIVPPTEDVQFPSFRY